MARITVEDCMKYIPNKFELVVLAANRVRSLTGGAKPKLVKGLGKNKEVIIALREIASGQLSIPDLQESAFNSFRKKHSTQDDDPLAVEGSIEDMFTQENWSTLAQAFGDEEEAKILETTNDEDDDAFDDENLAEELNNDRK